MDEMVMMHDNVAYKMVSELCALGATRDFFDSICAPFDVYKVDDGYIVQYVTFVGEDSILSYLILFDADGMAIDLLSMVHAHSATES